MDKINNIFWLGDAMWGIASDLYEISLINKHLQSCPED